MLNKFLIKKLVKNSLKIAIFAIIIVLNLSINVFALTKNNYERYIEDGYLGMSNVDFTINAKGQMYRKFGHFIIDGEYTGGDKNNPFYNDCDSRDLAIEAADGDSTYDVYAELDDEDIDYSYEDDEELTATDYDRAAFQARLEAMVYGNTYHGALGYGKYNLRPGKNLTAFIKFAYDFYKNVSGDPKVGCKNEYDLQAKGITDGKICPMELLETYANANYISAECVDGNFKNVWKDCTKYWNYEGSTLDTTTNIFEHLQDIFMAYVYLKPGYRKIRSHVNTEDINETDMCAILSMMYERFGGRPINPSKVESGDAIPGIGTADILPALIEYPDMSIADKIYTYMIEVKYKNSDLKLASWLKEYEDVMGYEYTILDSDDYDNFMKAYQVAFQKYGQDSANDTLLDYGFVLTPDIFESKISYTQALNKFANTIRSHFGNSSFYNNRNNAMYVAKSYAMAKKMCENSAFCDITDIYACDMDVVSHTIGYPNKNIILLADTQVVELNDDYGADCDTDYDGINDNREAHTPEEVDISSFVREYCKYNEYSQAETEEMLVNNSKVIMYNYSSNPVLPDSDFDGRSDLVDGRKLDNEYNSVNETNNYSNIKIKFSQDYRYFFMDSTKYYEDLAEMGLILSNMMCRKNGHEKTWKNNNSGEQYSLTGIREFMRYIGMDQVEEHIVSDLSTNELYDVPYILGQHDCIGILGKVNNLERNIITLCIGENEKYKDILAANYDGELGNAGNDDIHHMGYDYYADEILQDLIEYDNNQSGSRWNKSYWITGYGTGGAVANLVAKKFIDYKHVNTNIYCYTYQAPNTLNRNNLTKRIYNVKYQSIFNIENSDDIMLNLMGDDAGWTKYGVIKYLNVGDNKKSKNGWNKLTGQTYKSGSDFLNGLFSGIIDYFKDVFGFSSTYIPADDTDSVELARAVYAERMREESPAMRQQILELYKNEPQYLIQAKNIDYNGRVADIQATDFTAVDNVFIDEIATLLHDIIEAEQRAKDIERYNKSVETLIEWYTNHIATYRRKHDDAWEDKNGKSHTLYGSDDAENYYKTNVMQELKSTNSAINNLVRKHDSGRYVYYCDDIKKVKGHPWVGDDCTGLMMAIFQLYANEKLQNNSNEVFETNTINKVYTDSFSSSTDNWASKLLRNKANIHIYKVTAKTTVDDLDYGDILICEGGSPAHAEIFIDKEHSWGWGFKHCTKDQDNALGWQCTWLSQYDATKIRYGFVMKDRSVFVKDKDGNTEEYIKSDNRSYNIVLSANPNKNKANIELLFEGKGK